MPVALGIDLGTTYSCVAALVQGSVEVIPSADFGQRTTPSIVAFVDGEDRELVGEAASSQAARNLANTIVDAKRLIGRDWKDHLLQEDTKGWPFKVYNKNGAPRIEVNHSGKRKDFSPEEVLALVLGKLKTSAESLLGHPVDQAVITVPAYYTDSQRRATRKAGELAGLRVLRLIPEPTAAALAYGLSRKLDRDRQVLIYDLGGGTFDVSLITISGCRFAVRGVGGDSHLGGNDLDRLIADHLAQEVRRKLDQDVTADPQKFRRLLAVSERAKRNLSAMVKTDVDLLSVIMEEFFVVLTRAKVDEICKSLLKRTVDIVRSVLTTAKMSPADIDEVILVGGSTRMPSVERALADLFPGKPVSKTINPDEAVAHGAALWAAHLAGDDAAFLRGLQVQNVLPLSVGTEANGGQFFPDIPSNTAIPARAQGTLQTSWNDQATVGVNVYQGERLVAKHNKFIGKFSLKDLPPHPSGLRINYAISIDEDGILSVKAKLHSSEEWQGCTMQLADRTTTDIVRHAQDAEQHRQEDEREARRLRAYHDLLTFLGNKRQQAPQSAISLFEETDRWLTSNRNAAADALIAKQRALAQAMKGR